MSIGIGTSLAMLEYYWGERERAPHQWYPTCTFVSVCVLPSRTSFIWTS